MCAVLVWSALPAAPALAQSPTYTPSDSLWIPAVPSSEGLQVGDWATGSPDGDARCTFGVPGDLEREFLESLVMVGIGEVGGSCDGRHNYRFFASVSSEGQAHDAYSTSGDLLLPTMAAGEIVEVDLSFLLSGVPMMPGTDYATVRAESDQPGRCKVRWLGCRIGYDGGATSEILGFGYDPIDNSLTILESDGDAHVTYLTQVQQQISSNAAGVASNREAVAMGDSARALEDALLHARMDQEILDRIAQLDAERARAHDAEAALRAALDREISDRFAAVTNLAADLVAHLTTDGDLSPTNELQDLVPSTDPNAMTLTGGGPTTPRVIDQDWFNEAQRLTNNGDGTVTLSDVTNADGSVTHRGNTVSIEDADSVVGNEFNRSFQLIDHKLMLGDGGGLFLVDLSGYQNSDAQVLSVESIEGLGHRISISNGGYIELPDEVEDADADPSNELQSLGFDPASRTLSISGADGGSPHSSVTLPRGSDSEGIFVTTRRTEVLNRCDPPDLAVTERCSSACSSQCDPPDCTPPVCVCYRAWPGWCTCTSTCTTRCAPDPCDPPDCAPRPTTRSSSCLAVGGLSCSTYGEELTWVIRGDYDGSDGVTSSCNVTTSTTVAPPACVTSRCEPEGCTSSCTSSCTCWDFGILDTCECQPSPCETPACDSPCQSSCASSDIGVTPPGSCVTAMDVLCASMR
jgi:hypothetical protein